MLWLMLTMAVSASGFQCTSCPVGMIVMQECTTSEDTVCIACPSGFYSDDGVACYASNPGFYSLEGATNSTPCANGTFNANTAASSCEQCSVCADRNKVSVACSATSDTYCSDCVPCGAQTFMTGLLAMTPQCSPCTQCMPGTYVMEPCNGITDTVCGQCANTGGIFTLYCEFVCASGFESNGTLCVIQRTNTTTDVATTSTITSLADQLITTTAVVSSSLADQRMTTTAMTSSTTTQAIIALEITSSPNSIETIVSIVPAIGIVMLLLLCAYSCIPLKRSRIRTIKISI